MSEWSGYLKRAVANVESRLDQVLQESSEIGRKQDQPVPARTSSPRASIESRLNKALTGDAKGKREIDQKPQTENGETAEKEATIEPEIQSQAKVEPAPATTASSAEPDLDVVVDFEEFPSLLATLDKAKSLALSTSSINDDEIRDASLDLVDALQQEVKRFDSFNEYLQHRVATLHSKIKYLSAQNIQGLAGNKSTLAKKEEQIALLLDEGQRLSQQELKLNMSLKKLRAERASFDKQLSQSVKKAESLQNEVQTLEAKVKELSLAADQNLIQEAEKQTVNLRTELEQTQANLESTKSRLSGEVRSLKQQIESHVADKRQADNEISELNALVEHYRTMSESVHGQSAFGSQLKELQDRLESTRANHQVASDNWHDIEAKLLSNIADLEGTLDSTRTQTHGLQSRLRTLQDNLKSERDDKTGLTGRIESLETKLEQTLSSKEQQDQEVAELKARLEQLETAKLDADAKISQLESENTRLEIANQNAQRSNFDDSLDRIGSPTHDPAPVKSQLQRFLETDTPRDLPDDHIYEAETSIDAGIEDAIDEVPFNGPEPTERSYPSIHISNLSRQSIQSDELEDGPSPILGRLNLTIRRLENELSSAKQALELSKSEKESANAELVKYIDAQEELETIKSDYDAKTARVTELEAKLESVLVKLGEKGEQISELQADIADLKEMYQEQVTTLVDQIQLLKS